MLGSPAQAQSVLAEQEQANQIKAPEAKLEADVDLFGDNVNLYTGSLSFTQTDVTLPGNNALPVSIGRRLSVGAPLRDGRPFGRWELDVPHIHTTVSKVHGWVTQNGGTKRCSSFGAPIVVAEGTASAWDSREFWPGAFLYVPGAGDQRMLSRADGNKRAPAAQVQDFPVVTSEHWAFSCLPWLANDPSPNKTDGEGFIAVAPNGSRYRFDQMVRYEATTLHRGQLSSESARPPTPRDWSEDADADADATVSAGNSGSLARQDVWLLPTLLSDRFGNTVSYHYDPARPGNLIQIAASDGRVLDITYGTGAEAHLIKTVRAGTRTWQYSHYESDGKTDLDQVTLPDGSSWHMAGMSGTFKGLDSTGERTDCDMLSDVIMTTLTGSMVHPSGATASFTIVPYVHGRSAVPKPDCIKEPKVAHPPRIFFTNSLIKKIVSGPGLPELEWTYGYEMGDTDWAPCLKCTARKTVTVSNPEGVKTRYIFGTRFDFNEGKLLQVDHGWDGSKALRSVATRYRASDAGPYLPEEGIPWSYMGDAGSSIRTMPVDQRVTTQQGVTFTWQADQFDEWARPVKVTRSSSLGATRTETQDYEDNLSKWVLRQPRTLTESSTGKAVLVNEYDPLTANLKKVTRFGRVDQQMTYYTDGTLATRKDGNDHKTTFSKYKRGIPQRNDYPDGGTLSAVVNDSGTIATITDANSFTTAYSYDAANRLAGITPPAGDSVAWKPTINVYAKNPDWAYGLAPGHWVQTSQTGNAQTKTYYDAFFRPVVIHTMDVTEPLVTARFVNMGYNSAGHTTFTAYPQRSFEELANGVHQQYDALGRKTVTGTISEHGTIYSGNSYGDQFSTTYTTGRGHDTTTSYQVFDEPTDSAVVSISAPEGVSLSIHRDLFGKPLSVTRSGHGKSSTRSYVYDDQQRLCKTIEPETGATVQHLDGANNTLWRASGLTLLLTDQCETDQVLAKNKTSFGYDKVNRLLTTSYGDGSPGVSRTYTPDGLPKTVNSNGANWTYEYNRRRLLETETLAYASQTYKLTRGYDVHGSQSEIVYPDTTIVKLDPNALGEERQVGGYASAIRYHPNGALKAFTYGNGRAHSTEQNLRGLPETSTVDTIMKDQYGYDKDGNVVSIDDLHEGIGSRSMGYDGLSRLVSAHAPAMWGEGWYDYDALDNLIGSSIGAGATKRHTIHTFADATTGRLESITSSPGYSFNYKYDSQGNIIQRGAQQYVFDQGNRMKEATGKATYRYDGWGRRVSVVGRDGVNRIYFYSQDGKLMFSGASNAPKTRYIYLNQHVIAEDANMGAQYLHTDALGSPVARTDTAGKPVSRTRYEPYGLTAMGQEPSIGFAGHVNDGDTGLVYMQQRYYDPIAGRMLSIDPVVSDANSGDSFNRYAYANNNPYKFVDPDGRQVVKILLDIVKKAAKTEAKQGAKEGGKEAAKNGAKGAAEGAKRGPKTDPTAPHNAKVREAGDKVESKGGEVLSGGGRAKERLIDTPGGVKSGRRPDVIYRDASGVERGTNVGRAKMDGSPIKREAEALKDLNGPGKLPTDFTPYN